MKSSKVSLRPWTLEDIEFTLRVRNHPDLMKCFRQDKPLNYQQQYDFIKLDTGKFKSGYNGRVIQYQGQPVGLCGIKDTGEFTLGLLPEYQGKGIATEAMLQLINSYKGAEKIWSEVFVGNPALEWFIAKLGFRVTGVKERAYYKASLGLVDVVRIER